MKKVIPFKKELKFKTQITEITSISLEHTLSLEEDSLISGEFHISGDYKMTEASINKEPFSFTLPFDIAMDSRFDINNMVIDIEDFYYEIINNDILKVNIDVYIEGAELKNTDIMSDSRDNLEKDKIIKETNKIEEIDNIKEDKEDNRCLDLEEDMSVVFKKKDVVNLDLELEEKVNNANDDVVDIDVFENIDNNETFVTYKVYIVKEKDNLDNILQKYKVTKEILASYNDLTEIKVGDKLIIPYSNDE
ncbi:MAG: LysM peptidoglycan-binding domain-containing protein [bacterium]|nr:LysM peptidoglycan-binding domain-containing protein [bacterium]